MPTETQPNPDNIVVFLDSVQRTIIATKVESDNPAEYAVTKPVILSVQPTPDKKLQVQLYPLFFREFTSNRDEFPIWKYNVTAITTSDVPLEANLITQYKQMFVTNNTSAMQTGGPATTDGKVIKLFDDES